MPASGHWDAVWAARRPDQMSWYQAHPGVSTGLVLAVAPDRATPIVDVGGGASTLVDGLLDLGYRDVTVLDLAAGALAQAQERLGERAAGVTWLTADARTFAPSRPYGLWHDRAVFHFLTEERDRSAYRAVLRAAVEPGGHAIVGTFAPDGPESCSGLPVRRYGAGELVAALGEGFEPVIERREEHHTPSGGVQPFTFVVLRRTDG